jgi:hypothetical protein
LSLPAFLLACLLTPLPAAPQPTALQAGIQQIDSLAADADSRLAVVSAMADALGVHRNHLVLLRKETGQSYGLIFLQSLQKQGLDEEAIARRLQALEADIRQRISQERTGNGGAPASGVRPVLSLNTGVDYSSAATFVWVNPEFGIAAKRASLVAGVPYYRDSSDGTAVTGVGDAYAMGSLYGRAARVDLGTSLLVGFPSGDKNLGLGAGKTTVDVSGTLSYAFERARPFVSAGFGNSVFNFAYQRPYISDGNAAQLTGGIDFHTASHLAAGAAGFGVIPSGTQVVYSRIAVGQNSGSQTALPGSGGSSGSAGGSGGSGSGSGGAGKGGSPTSTPVDAPAHMPFLANSVSTLPASDLRDYGANAWASVTVARGVTLNFAVAHSVPFRITTARVSLGLDLPRLLFPSRW